MDTKKIIDNTKHLNPTIEISVDLLMELIQENGYLKGRLEEVRNKENNKISIRNPLDSVDDYVKQECPTINTLLR